MASKTQQMPQDNTGSSVLSQSSPNISSSSSVLASIVPLPEHPLIVYSVFACPSSTADPLDQLEIARRGVLRRNNGKSLLDSLLPFVHISKDAALLYVFAFGSTARTCSAHGVLSRLEFDTLTLKESSSFTPAAIYPCSPTCSTQATPCYHCLQPATAAQAPSPAQSLPRIPLRLPVTLLLQAVRDRLIDDIAEASKLHPNGRSVTRLKGGFLLGPLPFSSEWGSGWENHAHSRPLIFCNLNIHISLSQPSSPEARLLVHPFMQPTYHLPLRSSLPLPTGTPVVILPHGIPAYYLSTYSGPSAALTAQFEDALIGLGAGDWTRTIHSRASEATATSQASPQYIIVWLAVQNKQGEDKGMPVIWPSTLCVTYHASSPSPHARSSLPYIPELPAQLQASPPPPTSAVPTSLSFGTATSDAADVPASASTSTPQAFLPGGDRLSSSLQRRPTLLRASPTSDSLRAFRGLSLSKRPYHRDLKRVASEVNGYVDSVVKERERERERIRRERQEQDIANARAKLASANPPPVVETPAPPPPNSEPPNQGGAEAVTIHAEAPTVVPVEASEPESHPSVESDAHSGDSLFSPPDATVDLPSTEDESQSVPEKPHEEVPVAAAETLSIPVQRPDAESGPSSTGFDPFNGFDGSWGQQPSSYMDLDYGIDFMNIDSVDGTRTGGAVAGSYDLDDGMPFTDDDFDFFNAPSTQQTSAATVLPTVASIPMSLTSTSGSAPLGLTPLVSVDGLLSGPGPPFAHIPTSTPSTVHQSDAFTPRTGVDMQGILDNVTLPELLPPSPSRTPSSHSAPATPSVHLENGHRSHSGRTLGSLPLGPSIFDPIPFAASHRDADGKYAIGKFALPSPPAEEERLEPLKHIFETSNLLPGWKYKYSAVTDPRIGVVRKLIGVKRKSVDQGVGSLRRMPLWDSYRNPEEWQSSSPPPDAIDSEESDEEVSMEDNDVTLAVAAPARPSTPPPSYLPLGPTLLRTHFHHAHLLPLCTPLRPPGMAVDSTPGHTAPISVPTPVSPAAILGAASEKSKSLEAAAQILVKEVVDNPTWSEAWRANASLSLTPPVLPAKVWQADAKYIKQLRDSEQPPIELGAMFGQASPSADGRSGMSLKLMEAPTLVVGKGESLIQLSPTALRFWDKLGLSPRAGSKDVTAFVFFEIADEERENDIEAWLSRVSAAYTAKGFGAHIAGESSYFSKPGLAPTRFDTLRKTLVSFVSNIPVRHRHIIFYIVTPSHIISSSSTTLRQILSAVRRFYKAHPEGDILIHFVPESLILGNDTHPSSNLSGLDTFISSVYDRLLQPVHRAMSRKFFEWSAPVVGYFESPAYALSPFPASDRRGPHNLKVTFTLEPSASSLEVTHRHMLLHVGYQVSSCGRWILAACIDAEGESHDLKVWLTPDDNVESCVARQVWALVHEFARRANVEWRIVISKLGLMTHSELEAWATHLDIAVTTSTDVPPLHVSVLAIDNENTLTLLSPQEPASFDILRRTPMPPSQMPALKPSRHIHTTFSDAACTTYSLGPYSDGTTYPAYSVERTGKCGTNTYIPGSSEPSFIPDLEEEEAASNVTQPPLAEAIRAHAWSMIVNAPAASDHASLSTIRLFLLHVARSPRSSYGKSKTTPSNSLDTSSQSEARVWTELMEDIMRNFHDLAVLSRTRWKLHADPGLPFHLAALEVMRAALSSGAVDP